MAIAASSTVAGLLDLPRIFSDIHPKFRTPLPLGEGKWAHTADLAILRDRQYRTSSWLHLTAFL
jgi:hypothetical protein